ncbi:MAG: anthranilate phosphoribosyltransferase [Halioglobus sp.]|jgi:anthranilate phosphoribosyltransferase
MTSLETSTQKTDEHLFAQYVRILGKGKSGTRSLTMLEATDAFSMILRGEAEPVQIGAFLMLLRVKEETGEELAGFVTACRDNMLDGSEEHQLSVDLDWSSYAGKKHQHPWFVLSMLLLNQAGHRILVHGADGHTPDRLYTEQAFLQLGLPIALNWQHVDQQLAESQLSYLPLRYLCAPLNDLILLRPLLGLRSPVHTLTRMLNPCRASASIQSIFHPAYGKLHREADHILNQPSALVFKGDSGEVEVKPQADTHLMYLRGRKFTETLLSRTIEQRVTRVDAPSVEPLRALWRGENTDSYGLAAILATTAVALTALDSNLSLDAAGQRAQQLWEHRDQTRIQKCP